MCLYLSLRLRMVFGILLWSVNQGRLRILGRGLSPIRLFCGETLRDEHDVVGFPAFLSRSHRLWKFSDSAFHSPCFSGWEDREEFETIYQAFRELWEKRPKIPEGMEFSQFEKTEEYIKFQYRMDELSKRSNIEPPR